MTEFITLGQGSYGTIVQYKDNASIVLKIHVLSTDEIAYANEIGTEESNICSELFRKEFNSHLNLYSNINYVDVIIPQPIEYEYITRSNSSFNEILEDSGSACIYKMQKFNYPTNRSLNSIVIPSRLTAFKKTNPSVHSPPYLFFSGTSEEFQNGIIQLSDMDDVEQFQGLYYTIDNNAIERLANSIVDCFFQLTYRNQVILQDVEFLLTSNGNSPISGLIDFNQVVSIEDRRNAVRGRVDFNYSIEYDIANTYLFLSGIDTGFFMTDRNTNWKFLPTPNILPYTFFNAINYCKTRLPEEYHNSILSVIKHICDFIFEMDKDRFVKRHISKREIFNRLCYKIMIWYEILVYGMVSEDGDTPINIIVKMANENKLTYSISNELDINATANKYRHFTSGHVSNITIDMDDGYTYFTLTSTAVENDTHLLRFKQSQTRGEMTENLIYEKYPCIWFDIMYQRLFLIKFLSFNIDEMSDERIQHFEQMLADNKSFQHFFGYFYDRKRKTVRATTWKRSSKTLRISRKGGKRQKRHM